MEREYDGHCFECGHDWEEAWSKYSYRGGHCPNCSSKNTELYVDKVKGEADGE